MNNVGKLDNISDLIKEITKEIIEREKPADPLSDLAISDALKTRGLRVPRRTVARYRKELGIPSALKRRQTHCSFCGHTLEEVRRMAGPGGGEPDVYICINCATLFDEQINERKETDSGEGETGGDFRCSFCGQIRNAGRLAARERESGVCICDKCVEVRRISMMEN